MEKKLRIAVQKKGRLFEESMSLLKESGIKINVGSGKLLASARNYPLEILFMRDDDIPQTVNDGVADVGIVGENEYAEKDKKVEIVEKLGFSRCRLSLAIPQSVDYPGLSWFNAKTIATSYPHILGKYLKKNNINCEIHEITGSVEIAPGIGLADGIFDIVSSGSTLKSNALEEVEVVMQSEAVLIKNPGLEQEKLDIIEDLLFRIHSVQEAGNNKYILLNAPNENIDKIIEVLPGMKSPTILPLAESGWSSVHSVINENDFWGIIGKLKSYGAQGILIVPIEKMFI